MFAAALLYWPRVVWMVDSYSSNTNAGHSADQKRFCQKASQTELQGLSSNQLHFVECLGHIPKWSNSCKGLLIVAFYLNKMDSNTVVRHDEWQARDGALY